MEIVTKEKLIEITDRIKPLNNNWAADIAREMSLSPEWSGKPLNAAGVRHIVSGQINNPAKIMLYAKVAAKMLLNLEQTKSEAEKLISSL